MDFGEARFIASRNLNKQVLVVMSERHVGKVYKFHKKNEKQFACASCKLLGQSRTVTVLNGRIVGQKHPEEDHHVSCQPVSKESIDILEIDRGMRSDVRVTGKRPREAYVDAVTSITKKFKSTAEQGAIIQDFPNFSEISRSLYRHRAAENIPVPNPCDIPAELRTTLRGKSVGPNDENFQERFLLYSGQNGQLLVFCADSELVKLYNSDYVVCDGTFEMSPNSSYQLYSMHGFYREEGMPLVWGLLPNKTKKTYVELFNSIRAAFVEKFGNAGQKRLFLTDFETAAIEAIKEVFPSDTIKGCTFHYRQALMRRVTDLGLRPAYSSGPQQVQVWIRQIMGLTLLPEVFIPNAWMMLKQPPTLNDNDLMAKMNSFSNYFERTWISGSFSPSLWNHFSNTGPRTTNLAEGWHNSLNHSFGMPHPSARSFLNWLQKCQFHIQCRVIQLEAGRPAKQQTAKYRELNQRIAAAKLQFSLRSGSIFLNFYLHQNLWNALSYEIDLYLRYVSYLIGQTD